MSRERKSERKAAPAAVVGAAALAGALILLFWSAQWAVIPLAAFVLLCFLAPFFPNGGFFLPVISRGSAGKNAVSLTFDDGPDPDTTPLLLQLLKNYDLRAVFFVTGERAEKYPELVSAILAEGHEIGNHSHFHDPFLMMRSSKTLSLEIELAQKVIGRFGISVSAFRPPVGIISPKLAQVLSKQGMYTVTFSCRGNDFGNRRVKGLSGRILKKVKDGDIVLLHDIKPKGASVSDWLNEVDLILSGLNRKGVRAVPLGNLIDRPVMTARS